MLSKTALHYEKFYSWVGGDISAPELPTFPDFEGGKLHLRPDSRNFSSWLTGKNRLIHHSDEGLIVIATNTYLT